MRRRAHELGIPIGAMSPGERNAITDVSGVRVGHVTLIERESVRTGVTAILPAPGNLYQSKVPAGVHVGNGFGKLAGSTQVRELGTIETPILLTNTLSVPVAMEAIIEYALAQPGYERVVSVNAVVGETNDGGLNDIRGRHVRVEHALGAIAAAAADDVAEGSVGAGTGTVCFGYKGGIGTASRVLEVKRGGYTVGVLVQTNFGGNLQIAGMPVGRATSDSGNGSCMVVVATDAPVEARNLERLAKRAILGIGRTGGVMANGSGDYAIAFSTADGLRVPHAPKHMLRRIEVLHDEFVTPLFEAAVEATEEAIVNSLLAAESMTGHRGRRVEALPVERVLEMLRAAGRVD